VEQIWWDLKLGIQSDLKLGGALEAL